MRISSRPGDPRYNRLACGGITVYLDSQLARSIGDR